MRLALRFDMRSPDFGAPPKELYAAALDMAAWADEVGLDAIYLAEHHGSLDGYNPSPTVLAAAMAARTERIEIRLSALLAPLHHPIEMAENLAVLDRITGGRLAVTVGLGFRPSEFAMFDVELSERVARLERTLDIFARAWAGEEFEYNGEQIVVRPLPERPGGPPVLLAGTAKASARRAARLGLGYDPAPSYEKPNELWSLYEAACDEFGRPAPGPAPYPGPRFLYVTDDPERAWATIHPHIAFHNNTYDTWRKSAVNDVQASPYSDQDAEDDVRKSPAFKVVTPEQCLELFDELGPHSEVYFHPLISGLDPAFAWEGLHAFAADVLPKIRPTDAVKQECA